MSLFYLATSSLTLLVQPAAETIPGRYAAQAGEAICTLLMLPSATMPSSSQLTQTTQSGLATAGADCERSIRETGLWQYTVSDAGAVLSLVGQDGQVLWSGTQEGSQSWQGVMSSGENLILTRQGR